MLVKWVVRLEVGEDRVEVGVDTTTMVMESGSYCPLVSIYDICSQGNDFFGSRLCTAHMLYKF